MRNFYICFYYKIINMIIPKRNLFHEALCLGFTLHNTQKDFNI